MGSSRENPRGRECLVRDGGLFDVTSLRRERLSFGQLEWERRMLHEVPQDHVTARTGEAHLREVIRGDCLRKPVCEPFQRFERFEHLRIPRGVRSTALDDVRPVSAVLTSGVQKRSLFCQCSFQVLPERVDGVDGDFEGGSVRLDTDRPTVASYGRFGRIASGCGTNVSLLLVGGIRRAGEFLDQPRLSDFLYPPSSGGRRVTTYHSVVWEGSV